MSALEPTEEQVRTLLDQLTPHLTGDFQQEWRESIHRAWALIRDMVLEAAAQEISGPDQAGWFVERIRAMKGPP